MSNTEVREGALGLPGFTPYEHLDTREDKLLAFANDVADEYAALGDFDAWIPKKISRWHLLTLFLKNMLRWVILTPLPK